MSTLMLCRQIEQIIIEDKCAILCAESVDLSELIKNERHKLELDKFFNGKSLGYKIKENKTEKSPLEKLKEFFGEKLIIK